MTRKTKNNPRFSKLSCALLLTLISTITLLCFPLPAEESAATESAPATEKPQPIVYINPEVPSVNLPAYEGERYEVRVPDTLDLAERAKLAVRGLTSVTNPDADYEVYWAADLQNNPPFMWHDFNDHIQGKFHEALPLVRQASGSRENLQVDKRWMEITIQMQGPDGLLYYPKIGRPWATIGAMEEQLGPGGPLVQGDHFTEPYVNGRMAAATAIYYHLTGEERWKLLGQKIVDGLARQAVQRGDFAYYSTGVYPENKVSEPDAPFPEPWTNMAVGWISLGLAQFYTHTGYEPALELSGKLARFIRYHGGLFTPDYKFIGANGHIHGHLHPLLGMLEYARAADDWEMIQYVRKNYEFVSAYIHPLVGYVPETLDPEFSSSKNRPFSEICGVADMIHVALKLTLAGAGDYWDDVDRIARNQFAEGQLTRFDWVYEMVKNKPFTAPNQKYFSTDRVPERCIGTFGCWITPNDFLDPDHTGMGVIHCCTGNGSRAIYLIWENILHWKDGQLKVNLLLNRASPWADVDSWIPYEGRVDVKMKKACDLSIRIPEWVEPSKVRVQVASSANSRGSQTKAKPRKISFDGRYALCGAVQAKDIVTVTFPIHERTEVINIQGKDYTIVRKGNEVVHIDPPGKNNPFYQREKYRQNKVQWKTVERFVAKEPIAW